MTTADRGTCAPLTGLCSSFPTPAAGGSRQATALPLMEDVFEAFDEVVEGNRARRRVC
jgi:hypothetical protein